MPKETSINLLRASQTHYTETILKWALTTGRFLIILTETIALGAFVYRFSLDRQIIDLGDEIKDNAAIVSLYTEEPRFRNLHERLDYVEYLTNTPNNSLAILQDFIRIAQGKVTYQSLSVSHSVVTMSITTSTTSSLSSFIESVKSIRSVKTVSIDNVENKTGEGRITVELTAQLITNDPTTESEVPTDGI